MGRRYRRLWPELISFANLLSAFKKASRGKRSKSSVAAFEFDLEENLIHLREELRSGAYQPGKYDNFHIHDPKPRLISAAPFRDRVVHHALMNVTGPLFESQFIYDSYANRVGKGTHRALHRCTQYLRRFEFVMPLDIRQYFPSIDHAILEEIISRTIGDERVMKLCRQIIASGKQIFQEEYEPFYFPGDDLFSALRPRGLPIGNLTSQIWANVYLNGLDHYIKRQLHCRGYLRYVDDMLLFSDSKSELCSWRQEVIDYLATLRLKLHENSAQPRPCRVGVPFLGFQVFPDHRRVKRPKVIQARRRIKALLRQYQDAYIDQRRVLDSFRSWMNHVSYGDTIGLQKAIIVEMFFYYLDRMRHGRETIPHFQ